MTTLSFEGLKKHTHVSLGLATRDSNLVRVAHNIETIIFLMLHMILIIWLNVYVYTQCYGICTVDL